MILPCMVLVIAYKLQVVTTNDTHLRGNINDALNPDEQKKSEPLTRYLVNRDAA